MPSPIRLNKVLKELNISLDRAIEFLSSKNIEIEPRPTSKIDQSTYDLMLDEFQTDKSDKDKLEEINIKKRKELEKLRNYLNGIKDMPRIQDVIIVVDQLRELTAVKEAMSLNIPVISILDTNCDPGLVDLPIPGNDDSISSIQLILRVLSSNILSGQE